jgi:hypothetical protein
VYTEKGTRLAEEEKRRGHGFLDETEVEQERTDPFCALSHENPKTKRGKARAGRNITTLQSCL